MDWMGIHHISRLNDIQKRARTQHVHVHGPHLPRFRSMPTFASFAANHVLYANFITIIQHTVRRGLCALELCSTRAVHGCLERHMFSNHLNIAAPSATLVGSLAQRVLNIPMAQRSQFASGQSGTEP